MTTRTAEEALNLLSRTKSPLIQHARWHAIRLCNEKEQTHSREVREALAKEGALENVHDDRWLGAVFKTFFEPTGEEFHVQDKDRNIHRGRATRIWRLKEEYKGMTLPALDQLAPVESEVRIGRFDQLIRDAMHAIGNESLRITTVLGAGEKVLITVQWRTRSPNGQMSAEKFETAETLELALMAVLHRETLDKEKELSHAQAAGHH
jgi:hypothetical protein